MSNLIRNLEKDGCIITINPTHDAFVNREYGELDPSKSVLKTYWDLPDVTTTDFVIAYLDMELIPTPLLSALVSNDFRSNEDIQFRRQQRGTWAAIAVAIVFGVVTALLTWRQTKISSDAVELSRDQTKLSHDAVELSRDQTKFARDAIELSRSQTKLSSDAVAVQAWQYLGQPGTAILKVFVDHPDLRPYFYDGKTSDSNDPNYGIVMTVAEMYLDYFDSFTDPFVRSLDGMEEGGKNWVLWERWFREMMESSPMLYALAEEMKDEYAMDFTKYMPKKTATTSQSTGQPSATNGLGASVSAVQPVSAAVPLTTSPVASINPNPLSVTVTPSANQ